MSVTQQKNLTAFYIYIFFVGGRGSGEQFDVWWQEKNLDVWWWGGGGVQENFLSSDFCVVCNSNMVCCYSLKYVLSAQIVTLFTRTAAVFIDPNSAVTVFKIGLQFPTISS